MDAKLTGGGMASDAQVAMDTDADAEAFVAPLYRGTETLLFVGIFYFVVSVILVVLAAVSPGTLWAFFLCAAGTLWLGYRALTASAARTPAWPTTDFQSGGASSGVWGIGMNGPQDSHDSFAPPDAEHAQRNLGRYLQDSVDRASAYRWWLRWVSVLLALACACNVAALWLWQEECREACWMQDPSPSAGYTVPFKVCAPPHLSSGNSCWRYGVSTGLLCAVAVFLPLWLWLSGCHSYAQLHANDAAAELEFTQSEEGLSLLASFDVRTEESKNSAGGVLRSIQQRYAQ